MTDEQRHYPWDEGLPTKPDVDLLLRTWPTPEVGNRYEYDTVERLLGVKFRSPRFKTITTQWRKRLLESGIVVECETAKAFYVASTREISAATYGTLKSIGRKARKHRIKLSTTKPVDETERGIVEHQGRLMLNVERDARKSRMSLVPPTAAANVPQIGPPKKDEPKETRE